MAIRIPEDRSALVPAVERAPTVLVGFLPSQEVKLSRAFADRFGHRMGHDQRAGTFELEGRVETGEIGIGAVAMVEAVINRDYLAGHGQGEQPKETVSRKRRRSIA